MSKFKDLFLQERPRIGIRNICFIISIIIIFIGSIIGVGITHNAGMFYNILLMPFLGVLGYFTFRSRWFYVLIEIMVISFVGIFIKNALDGMLAQGLISEAISGSVFFTFLYAFLVIVGVFVGMLLGFAFEKERK